MSDASRNEIMRRLNISAEDLEKAVQLATARKTSLMHAIELLRLAPEELIVDSFSKILGIQKVDLSTRDIHRSILDLIPGELARSLRVIPIDRAGNNMIVAMGDPRNWNAINTLRFKEGFFARPVLASELRISEALDKYYGKAKPMTGFATSGEESMVAPIKKKEDARLIIADDAPVDDGPVIKFVNSILKACLKRGASDIHIETYEGRVRVRLRIDGTLHEIASPPPEWYAAICSRVKIMSELNISETRLPQDGAINVMMSGKPVDFRVNSLPTVYGEKIVLRILDKSALKVDMTQLGFEHDELKKFKDGIHRPFGMVLVTGPTGSGKTTTLYSALSELNQESDNVVTAEDPVEYNIEGINQVAMKPKIGLTFATALKAFLRQDPDTIMVGEIRDLETAGIAINAALTGHMVLSTLHTNSAPETISRLLNMGVESFNLVSALTCVTAQRLARKICKSCRMPDERVTVDALIRAGATPDLAATIKAFVGKGCQECGDTGKKGRIALHEVMTLTEPIKQAILRNANSLELKKVAMESGMRSLRQSGLLKLGQGVISIDEVTSVTAPDKDEEEPGIDIQLMS